MKSPAVLYASILAFAISITWTYFNRYEYVGNNLFLFDQINVFPLTLWTIGLTLLYIIHTKVKSKYPLFTITVIYLICIGLLEAFGYHVLHIRLNSNEPSLLGLGIIHAPFHMKIFYIVAGPLYIMATDFLLKNIRGSKPSNIS